MKSISTMPAGGMFEVPDVVLALLLGYRAAHVGDIAGGRLASSRPHQDVRMMASICSRNSGDAEITRARVSAMCSQVQASLLIVGKGIDPRGQRPGAARGRSRMSTS